MQSWLLILPAKFNTLKIEIDVAEQAVEILSDFYLKQANMHLPSSFMSLT